MPRTDAEGATYSVSQQEYQSDHGQDDTPEAANQLLDPDWKRLMLPLETHTDLKVIIWSATLSERDTQATDGRTDETHAERWLRNTMNTARQYCERVVEWGYQNASTEAREKLHARLEEDGASLDQWRGERTGLLEKELAWEAARTEHIRKHCFPIVTAEAAEWMRQKAGDRPIVEIGAGNGYLAKELNGRGMNVHPTDPNPPAGDSALTGRLKVEGIEVEEIDGLTALSQYPEANLLWSWPDPFADDKPDYDAEILRRFQGKTFIYIGEGDNGCTGSPAFHRVLETNFTAQDTYRIPNFPNIHDRIVVYQRKT